MEINFEMSPLTESGSDSISVPYSHMAEEEAQIAFSARKDQIRKMLKSRSSVQTPDSDVKSSVSSIRSKQSVPNPQVRFTVDPEKVSKHVIDSSLGSQNDLRDRLKNFSVQVEIPTKKYNVAEPIYQRTVEWKQNLDKKKEGKKEENEKKIAEDCTFEPALERSEVRNMSVGIYERNVQWKNSMIKKNEIIKDLNFMKEVQECTFVPKILNTGNEFSVDFQQRNQIWKERMMVKAKKIEEANTKDHVFYPKVNKASKKYQQPSQNLDNRFSAFLSKLDEITEKIDNSLGNSVH